MRPGPGVVNEPGVVIVDVRDVRVPHPAPDDQARVHGLAHAVRQGAAAASPMTEGAQWPLAR